MLLAVDVGNTSSCFGVFRRTRLVKTFRLPTSKAADPVWLRRHLRAHLHGYVSSGEWEGAVLASVVPEILPVMAAGLRSLLRKKVMVATSQMVWSAKNRYRPPKAVGVDRLVNAAAAVKEFGPPVLIVDFGTAITVDAVDAAGNYLGGAILPGLELSAWALAEKAALLPRVVLKKPSRFIGGNTLESLRVGIVAGLGGGVSYLVRKMTKILGKSTAVVATGGLLKRVLPFCPELEYVRPWLTLRGLQQIWAEHES